MGFGLLAAAGLNQCQPACTPAAPGPVETTTTVAETTTTAATTTTTMPATTTTVATSPFSVRGFGCDDFPSMSGWVRYMYAEIAYTGSAAGYTVSNGVVSGPLGDSLFEPGIYTVNWPGTGTGHDLVFNPTMTVTVRDGNGNVVYSEVLDRSDVAALSPGCLPLLPPA
jgi:hypothetical protein